LRAARLPISLSEPGHPMDALRGLGDVLKWRGLGQVLLAGRVDCLVIAGSRFDLIVTRFRAEEDFGLPQSRRSTPAR